MRALKLRRALTHACETTRPLHAHTHWLRSEAAAFVRNEAARESGVSVATTAGGKVASGSPPATKSLRLLAAAGSLQQSRLASRADASRALAAQATKLLQWPKVGSAHRRSV